MSSPLNTVLVVTIPDHAPKCFQIDGTQTQIGRGTNNHLRIDEEAVSKTHCEFVMVPETGQWIFRDLGSTNGSELNGEPVGWDVLNVYDGDEIVLGNVVKILLLAVHEIEVPESLSPEGDDPDVNPVAAAMARQANDDMEFTQLIKLKSKKRKR